MHLLRNSVLLVLCIALNISSTALFATQAMSTPTTDCTKCTDEQFQYIEDGKPRTAYVADEALIKKLLDDATTFVLPSRIVEADQDSAIININRNASYEGTVDVEDWQWQTLLGRKTVNKNGRVPYKGSVVMCQGFEEAYANRFQAALDYIQASSGASSIRTSEGIVNPDLPRIKEIILQSEESSCDVGYKGLRQLNRSEWRSAESGVSHVAPHLYYLERTDDGVKTKIYLNFSCSVGKTVTCPGSSIDTVRAHKSAEEDFAQHFAQLVDKAV